MVAGSTWKKAYLFFIIILISLTAVDAKLDDALYTKSNEELVNVIIELRNHEDTRLEHKRGFSSFPAYTTTMRMDEILDMLENDSVVRVYEDYEILPFLSGSVPLINASQPLFDQYTVTGKGQGICIIDTGVDYTHPSLGGCTQEEFLAGTCEKVIGGYNIYYSNNDPIDVRGHGTHVAGIAAANGSVVGVAPGASIIAMNVFPDEGSTSASYVISAIEWCTNNAATYNISVISLSLGGTVKHSNYCNADAIAPSINAAVNQGIAVVVATGNSGWTDGISSPSCIESAIRVGGVYKQDHGPVGWGSPLTCSDATTAADKMVCHTNRNHMLDLLAPGAIITSTWIDGNTHSTGGTSMATPHVSGALAVLLEHMAANNISTSPSDLNALLKDTGKDIYDADSEQTYSRINLGAALQELIAVPQITAIELSQSIIQTNTTVTVNVSLANHAQVNNVTAQNVTLNNTATSIWSGNITANTSPLIIEVTTNLGAIITDNQTTFIFDDDAPQIQHITINPQYAMNQSTTFISITYNETNPGYANLSIDGNPATLVDESPTQYNFSYFIDSNVTEGNKTILITIVDAAGNNVTAEEYLIVDLTPPQVHNVTAPSTAKVGNFISIAVNASDDFGVDQVTIAEQNLTYNGSLWTGSILFTEENNTIMVTDRAGNQIIQNISITPDNTPPVTSLSATIDDDQVNISQWKNQSVNITLSVVDAEEGDFTQYRLGNSVWQTYDEPFTIEQTTVLRYRSVDLAGNYEAVKRVNIRIDTQPPHIEWLSVSNRSNPDQPIIIAAKVTDDNSGLESVSATVNGTTTQMVAHLGYYRATIQAPSEIGSYTVEITAQDAAGNIQQNSTSLTVSDDPIMVPSVANNTYVAENSTITFSTLENINFTYSINDNDASQIMQGSADIIINITPFSIQFNATDGLIQTQQTFFYQFSQDPPSCEIVNIDNDATIQGITQLQVNSTDDTGIEEIQVHLNETQVDTTESINTFLFADGDYQLIATCLSYSGLNSTDTKNITINNAEIVTVETTGVYAFFDDTSIEEYVSHIEGIHADNVSMNFLLDKHIEDIPSTVQSMIAYMNITASTQHIATIHLTMPTQDIQGDVYVWIDHGLGWTQPSQVDVTIDGDTAYLSFSVEQFSEFIIGQIVPQCSIGAITQTCTCSGQQHESGYCCSGGHQAGSCTSGGSSPPSNSGGGGGGGSGGGGAMMIAQPTEETSVPLLQSPQYTWSGVTENMWTQKESVIDGVTIQVLTADNVDGIVMTVETTIDQQLPRLDNRESYFSLGFEPVPYKIRLEHSNDLQLYIFDEDQWTAIFSDNGIVEMTPKNNQAFSLVRRQTEPELLSPQDTVEEADETLPLSMIIALSIMLAFITLLFIFVHRHRRNPRYY